MIIFKICAVCLAILFAASVAHALPHIVWDRKVETNQKVVCLTFDDGPNADATLAVLDVLRTHGIKATFFAIGKNVERFPEVAKQIVDAGHELGNHGYTAGYLLFVSSTDSVRKNLQRTNKVIIDTTGQIPKYFRPPNGVMTKTMSKITQELRLKTSGVNVFVFDHLSKNSAKIAKKVMKRISGGPLTIVLHDGLGTRKVSSRKVVAEVANIIIPKIQRMGYRFGDLDECLCDQNDVE